MQLILTETNNKLLIQSNLVVNLKKQIFNFQTIIDKKNNQADLSRDLNKRLQADLQKQKLKNKLTMGGGVLVVVGVLFLTK